MVDGYNIIFAWRNLKAKAERISLDAARIGLLDILCNYQGLKQNSIIAVFDAHNVKGGVEKVEPYNNITVVFTKEAETADHYIERTAGVLSRYDRVWVATSDYLEQMIILSKGANRITAETLSAEIKSAEKTMRINYIENKPLKKNPLMQNLDVKTAELLNKMRFPKGQDK